MIVTYLKRVVVSLTVVLAILIGLTISVGIIFSGISAVWRYQCHVYGTNTKRQVNYSFWSGQCYVKTPNGWFTYDQINQNNINK